MPFDIGQLGMQAASGAVNTGLGLLLEKHNDRRQLRMNKELGNQQLGLNLQQMRAGKDMDLQFWKDTNYAAQVEEMRKAGLSPGLIYGMGGTGGALTGGNAGGVNTPEGPKGGGEIMGLQLMGAQKRLLDAQAKDAEASAELKQADTGLRGEQTQIARLERMLKNDSYENVARTIAAEMIKVESEAKVAGNTWEDSVMIRKGELVAIGLANELKRVEKGMTEAQTEAILQSIKQKWQEVNIKQGQLDLDRFIKDVADSTRLTVETVSKVLSDLSIKRIKKVE